MGNVTSPLNFARLASEMLFQCSVLSSREAHSVAEPFEVQTEHFGSFCHEQSLGAGLLGAAVFGMTVELLLESKRRCEMDPLDDEKDDNDNLLPLLRS